MFRRSDARGGRITWDRHQVVVVVVIGQLGLGGRVIDEAGLTRSASVCLFQFPCANLWMYHFCVHCDCELGKGEEVELRGVRKPFIDGFLSTIGTFYKTITLCGVGEQISSAGVVVLKDNWAQAT